MPLSWKSRSTDSGRFSEVIRDASSEEKKKVYTKVMKRASEAQIAVLSRHHTARAK